MLSLIYVNKKFCLNIYLFLHLLKKKESTKAEQKLQCATPLMLNSSTKDCNIKEKKVAKTTILIKHINIVKLALVI